MSTNHIGVVLVHGAWADGSSWCRDGPGAYGEAVRRALPAAVQVSDRWHLWHGLAEAVQKEVAAHSACRAAAPLQVGKRAGTKLERWQQIHDLLSKGTGLRECARRLDLSLSTVRRYARADRPERLQRARQYRSALAGRPGPADVDRLDLSPLI